MCKRILQLPCIFLNILHQRLSQLASFSTNLVNNNVILHREDGVKLIIAPIQQIVKYADCFFDRMENHILKGTFPNTVFKSTLRDANPKYQTASMIGTIDQEGLALLAKLKPDAFPPGTPACKRVPMKQRLKPTAEAKDFTMAGILHCKMGFPPQIVSFELIKEVLHFLLFPQ